MAHVSPVPFEHIDPEVQQIMQTYDKEYGGSAFLQAFAHAPEVFKSFANYYFPLIFETRGSIDMKLTELVRLKVAERNDCAL
ncbi:MAG: hypothetical protein OXC18_03325 [Desulfurellaceae bacterium]|nr:hypothetical protein [Desulfurellaceae bacterium]